MSRPVYAIPPSFKDQELDLDSTNLYLEFLGSKGATRVLTTAGTSQFNLLSLDEIRKLNSTILSNFSKEKIIGLPALPLKHLITEIQFLNKLDATDTSILILFPERYYSDNQIIKFFNAVCSSSNYNVLLHGNPLKRGNGGTYEYSNSLLAELSKIDKFVGIKEEYSSLDLALKSIQNLDLDIIVAGGSMRRFWTLEPFGASSFLTGVGNFDPEVAEDFYDMYMSKKYAECKAIIEDIETPFFNTFMSIGWHAAMREGLNQMGLLLENRDPFHTLGINDKQQVQTALKHIIE